MDRDKWYIGVNPCGCVTAIRVQGLDDEEEELAEWKKEGLSIETATLEEARERLTECKCEEKE